MTTATTTPCILAATDGSEGASRAVEMAARLSKQLGEELLKHQGMSEGEALEILSREILSDAKKHARSAGASAIRVLACVGDPAELILDVARRERVDMLIVGRRGRGRLAGLLLGSVFQKMASLLAPRALRRKERRHGERDLAKPPQPM